MTTHQSDATAQRILDTALKLAEANSWNAVQLHHIAEAVGVTLKEVHERFRDKEDLIDAWFERADSAMLQNAAEPDFLLLPRRARLHRLIMAWLDTLAPHRRITRQMVLGTLQPGYGQLRAIKRTNRTVQWIYEASRRNANYLQRTLEETGLTGIYLTTLFYWMTDDSQGSASTRRFLDRLLAGAMFPLNPFTWFETGGIREYPPPGWPPPSPETSRPEPVRPVSP